jgi:hypothetical protein
MARTRHRRPGNRPRRRNFRSISAECAAEEQEYRDEDGDPEDAGREAKSAAEAEARARILVEWRGACNFAPRPANPLAGAIWLAALTIAQHDREVLGRRRVVALPHVRRRPGGLEPARELGPAGCSPEIFRT